MRLAFLVLLLAALVMMSREAGAGLAVEPPSKWVAPLKFDKPGPQDSAEPAQDYRWLLSDRQINALNDEEFVHEVRQTLTAAGAQENSHIIINYDPSCQSLTLHWIRLWRGTNKLDRLDLSKFHVSPAGLGNGEESLFGSQKTAFLLLDDVQAGDIVDYAYTIEGVNPALGGKFAGSVPLQFRAPIDRAVTRLIWPPSRHLYIKNHLTDVQPKISRMTNAVQYLWEVGRQPELRVELPAPVWYDPYPWIELTEFQRWTDVNRWALRMFTTTNPPSPEMVKKIDEWKRLPEPAERVGAALRFVQDEVRYLAEEDGQNGFEPAQPAVVFARRFGDIKEKSFLLVDLLRALKIQAFPVLVNDRRRQELAEFQPSPMLFNKVVVQVNLNGQNFWLDTKGGYERGGLAFRYWPNYGVGLTVASNSTALTGIPPCPVQPRTTVTEYLDVGGINDRATVKIITVAEGPDATRQREHFAMTPREDIERDNLNAYERVYPFMSRTAPMEMTDDEQQNRIETTEYYAIDKMWSQQPDEPFFHCKVYSFNIDQALVKPAASQRSMPLAVPFPVNQIFHAIVSVPTGWPINPSTTSIEDPAFRFQRLVNVVDHRLAIDYEFHTWTDALAPEAVPGYVRDLDSATDAVTYTVIGL